MVQNLILQCILKHKTKKETEELLFQNHNIEHTITGGVWELMEAKNEGFFKSYSGLLTTKETFNSLFARQVALLGIAPPSSSRGPAQGNQSVGGAASLFGQSSASLVSSSSTSNPFASKPSSFSSSGFGSTVSSDAFTYIQSLTPSSPFGSTSSTSSLFSSQNPAFTPSMFSTTGSSTFGLSNSLFGTSLAQGTTNTFGLGPNFSNSQSLPFFQSSTPSMPPSSSPFGQSMSSFGHTTSAISQNAFNPPSSGFGGNMFASTLSLGQRNIMRDSELKKTRSAKGKQISKRR